MKKVKYDFAGWVTKNDIRCSDGVTIKHDAFKDNDGKKVPLVWNHDYSNPSNVLGHVTLKNQDKGVYGYGYLNDTNDAENVREMLKHGDLTSMSIGAKKIKRQGTDVIHGDIYEVSLVLAGANPGAMIETVMRHADNGVETEEGIIFTGTIIHSADDIVEVEEEEKIIHKEKDMGNTEKTEEKTVGEVFETLNEEQKEAVYALLGSVVESYDDEEDEDEEGDEPMKQNVFNKGKDDGNDILRHGASDALAEAIKGGASSLKQVLQSQFEGDELKHGINSIEMLFPEADYSTNGNEPLIYRDPNTSATKILNKITKSPFANVRTLIADLTEEEARAKGYIKGTLKKEEFFSLIKRKTGPTTIYKKQKLDRDDLIDITDFNVVAFMNREMRFMINEEMARAALVGDGRDVASEDKINEQNIRPIITDHEFFTIHKSYTDAMDFMEAVILGMAEYRGSGLPDMYIDQNLLAAVKLLKGTDDRYLFGDIPSTAAVAARLGIGEIIPTTFMIGKGALIVNLSDYHFGATKGGQLTTFDDFDIDFNQYKYLIETRLSGALVMPKSAIHFAATTPLVGANDTVGGVTWGDREADKL